MTFRQALTQLASLSIAGVAHNYDIDAVPDELYRPQLPALLCLPGATQENALFNKQRGGAFVAQAFAGGVKTVRYTVTHLLFVAYVTDGLGEKSLLPRVVDLIDTYMAAIAADPLLANNLQLPAEINIEPGTFKRGNVEFQGCAFRHTWVIQA